MSKKEREKDVEKDERSTLRETEQQLLETRKDLVDNLHRQAHGGPPSFVPATMHLTC